MEEQKQMTGEATAEQIADWKKKYADVYAIKVDESVCYVHKPDRKCLSALSTIATNPVKASEFLLNNCWLGGDETIKTDDSKFFGAISQLGNIVEVKKAELEKL